MKSVDKKNKPKYNWKFLISGVLSILLGVILAAFALKGEYDCWKQCYADNGSDYMLAGIFLASGFILITIFLIKLAIHNKIARVFVMIFYLFIVLFAAYVFKGNSLLNENNFYKKSGITFYKITKLPEGYKEATKSYYYDNSNSIGTNFSISYRKPSRAQGKWSTFKFEQGNFANQNARGILDSCGKNYECDTVDGQNVKNILCQKSVNPSCSVRIGDTYITIKDDNDNSAYADVDFDNPEFTKEEAISVLDSLVPR